MITKYELLKDLPNVKAGAIFELVDEEELYIHQEKSQSGDVKITAYDSAIIQNEEWFEPIPSFHGTA